MTGHHRSPPAGAPTASEKTPQRRWRAVAVWLSLAAWVTASLPAVGSETAGADEPPVHAVRLQPGEVLKLDGSLSHPAWQRAPVFDRLLEHDPRRGAQPPQRTQVQVLFDERAVYVGVKAFDDRPQDIRDVPVRYDTVNRTQDFVVAYIDPIGHRASAQFFRVNAAGSLADGIHTAADDSEDFAPDFDWDAAVQRQADGWTAVMRIPFASLRFAEGPQGGWRFMLARRMPREQFHLLTSVALPHDAPSFIHRLQPLTGVSLPAEHSFLTLRPSLTLRTTRQRDDGQPQVGKNHVEASLDIKWRPRAELVIDGTLKPDFSQVALDVPQLAGNSRFALFLPEKRPFFFESADLLRTPTEALYTRSITQPGGGLRATWRAPAVAGTALAASDEGGGTVLLPGPYGTDAVGQPASRVLLARLRRADDSAGLAIGGLLASRRYDDGRGENTVFGPDLDASFDGGWSLRAQWLGSRTTALAQAGSLQAGTARLGHRGHLKLRQLSQHTESSLTLDDIGTDFRHDTGFVNQTGVRQVAVHHAWKWYPLGPFNHFELYADAREVRDRVTGQTVERTPWLGFWAAGSRNLEWWVDLRPQEQVRATANGPLLNQRFVASGLVMTPANWWPLVDTQISVGRLADTIAQRVRPGARWRFMARMRPGRSFEIEPSISQAWLFDDRPGHALQYHESAAQLLAIWHLDANQHLRLIAQRSGGDRKAEDQVTAQRWGGRAASLTYNWRRSSGTQLYVGYSVQHDGRPATSRGREAFVKLQVDADEWLRAWR